MFFVIKHHIIGKDDDKTIKLFNYLISRSIPRILLITHIDNEIPNAWIIKNENTIKFILVF